MSTSRPQTPEQKIQELQKALDAEQRLFNRGNLMFESDDKLREAMATSFKNGTAYLNNATMLLKHVSVISEILNERQLRKKT